MDPFRGQGVDDRIRFSLESKQCPLRPQSVVAKESHSSSHGSVQGGQVGAAQAIRCAVGELARLERSSDCQTNRGARPVLWRAIRVTPTERRVGRDIPLMRCIRRVDIHGRTHNRRTVCAT